MKTLLSILCIVTILSPTNFAQQSDKAKKIDELIAPFQTLLGHST